MSNTALNGSIQTTSALVALYTLDATRQIGQIIHFCNEINPDGSFVKFNGVTYYPFPVTTDGYEQGSEGLEARPTITIADVGRSVSTILADSSGMRSIAGAILSKTFVYSENLDNGSNPASVFTEPQVFIVENLTSGMWGQSITWQLMTPQDMPDLTTPRKKYTNRDYPGIR